MTQRRTTIWGWGLEDEQPTPEQKKNIAKGIAESVGASDFSLDPEPRVEDIQLRTPRLSPPEVSCQHLLDRNLRPRGPCLWQSPARYCAGLPSGFSEPTRCGGLSKTEDDVVAVLDWCNEVGAAAIPFGGGFERNQRRRASDGGRLPWERVHRPALPRQSVGD